MTDPFLEDCGGWTPAPDILAKKYGFESAYLWGKLRRLCQLGNGQYTISPEALGKRFGMSRRTVIDRLKAMIRDGYVEDLTPGVRNKAHTYSVKKGEEKLVSGVQISHTKGDIPTEPNGLAASESDLDMRIPHSDNAEIAHQNDPGMQELPSRYAKNAHPGMQNLHLNRESLETIKETPNGVGKKPSVQKVEDTDKTTPLWQLMNEFVKLTGIQMPHGASRKGDWWEGIREIYETANRDVDVGKRLIRDAIEEARQGNWKVYRPGSLVRTAGRLMAKPKPRITAL